MAKCDTAHTEKYAFSSRHKDSLDLFVEIEVTKKTRLQTKACLAVDGALQRGIVCGDLDLGRAAAEHEEGASHFDSQAHIALCIEVGRVMCEAEETGIEEDYIYYEHFEWGSAGRLVV